MEDVRPPEEPFWKVPDSGVRQPRQSGVRDLEGATFVHSLGIRERVPVCVRQSAGVWDWADTGPVLLRHNV